MIQIDNKFDLKEKIYIGDNPGMITKISIDHNNVIYYLVWDFNNGYTWFEDFQIVKESDYKTIGFSLTEDLE